jgi:hypothetical protein
MSAIVAAAFAAAAGVLGDTLSVFGMAFSQGWMAKWTHEKERKGQGGG